MVKTVILLRHGPYNNHSADEELTSEGRDTVARVADFYNDFADNESDIAGTSGIIISGTATRCVQTADIVFRSGKYFNNHIMTKTLNMGCVAEAFDEIKKLSDDCTHAVLVTHDANINMWKFNCRNADKVFSPGLASGFILKLKSWHEASFETLTDTKILYTVSPHGIVPL